MHQLYNIKNWYTIYMYIRYTCQLEKKGGKVSQDKYGYI